MKKCPLCGVGKARRICSRHGGVEVCSQCCAAVRDDDCGDCEHYRAAQHHRAARTSRAPRPEGDFLIELSPETEEAVNGALELALRGKTGPALKILTGLHRERPRNHGVCFGIGAVHVMLKEFPKALEWFDRALAIFPYMIEAHFNKAVAHLELMDVSNSIRSYRKVVEFGDRDDPDVNKAREHLKTIGDSIRKHHGIGVDSFLAAGDAFNRAVDLMEAGAWQEAANGFRKALALNERTASSHGNLGLCYAKLGHKSKALAELDRALELDPHYELARINRKVVAAMTEDRPLENGEIQGIDSNQERLARMEAGRPPGEPTA